jgi:hypothetical protein
VVTLEAQFFFKPHSMAHCHRPGWLRILPSNGLNEPSVLITTQKVMPLKTVQQQLNNVNLDLMMDLLKEIFASSIVDRICKTIFDSSWKKMPSAPGVCLKLLWLISNSDFFSRFNSRQYLPGQKLHFTAIPSSSSSHLRPCYCS